VKYRLAALVSAVALASQCLHAQGLPDLGDVSAATLSESQERTIGNRIMREVRMDPAYIDDPEIADYLTSIGSRLLGALEVPRKDIDFFGVQDESINAFAMVGGHIGVHTGLILLTQNESELAAVIGHEIGHVVQKHQARMAAGMGRSQLTSLAALAVAILASRAGGSSGGQATEAAMATSSALMMQNMLDYTREHEREADRVGYTLLERAGFDPKAMVTIFERMLRANRLNEFKGAPAYLRTHPLTTERISDMQGRVDSMSIKPGVLSNEMSGREAFEYRLTKARIRALQGSPAEAVGKFRTSLAEYTVVRPREEVYGLAVAQRRARDFDGAFATLAPIRTGTSHPAFELLAGQIKADQRRDDEALAIYRAAIKASPSYRALVYGYLEELLQSGHANEALNDLNERLRTMQEDSKLYELQARAFEATGRGISQHRAQAEAAYRRGNLPAAVEQLELAVKARGTDFYELSSAEARLREMRRLLENERSAEKALKIS
jgi:predicted Zn-dependent protease